jgi:hypothetical protein
MKPFTQAILLLGLITLFFYALNPLEPFDTTVPTTQLPTVCTPDPNNPSNQICGSITPVVSSKPQTQLNFSSMLSQYKQMTPEQQAALQAQVRQQRNQLGLVDSRFFNAGLHPELNQQLPDPSSHPPQPSQAPTPDTAFPTNNPTLNQASDTAQQSVTLSDVQSLINSQVQSQLANQPVANCGLSKTYTDSPNYNEILKLADEQRKRNENHQRKKEEKRESCKTKINRKQATYRPTPQSCAPPDPTIWIKRNEIPCWNCKV